MNDEKSIFQYESTHIPDFASTTKDISATIGDKVGTSSSAAASKPLGTISTEDGTKIVDNPNAVHVKRYIFYLKKG